MSDWIVVGDSIVNVDAIEYVERKKSDLILVYMGSGKVIELTSTMALSLWKYLDSEGLKFIDMDNPTQDFSGT